MSASVAITIFSELVELVIDQHAQRLKRARRRILAWLASTYRLRNNRRELTRANNGMLPPLVDDRLRHTSREAFFTECCNHFANLVDARPSEPG